MSADRYYSDHSVFIDNVRKLVAAEVLPSVTKWEDERHFPNELFTLLGSQGYLGLLISEEYGGIGGDYHLAGAWCETWGEVPAVGLTTAVNMHSLVISHALEKYGTEAAKSRWLPEAVTGNAIGAYAFTEPGAGSDLSSIRTKAVREGSEWVLSGSKTFITNGARADFVLVLAKTNPELGYKGFTTFVVDTSLRGFSVTRKLDKVGWHSSDTAELSLDGIRLTDECILGKTGEGWIQASNNLNWERLMLTLTSLAGARMVFRDALRYAENRHAFGKRIRELDPVSSLLESMYVKIATGERLCRRALDLLRAGKDCRLEVSTAKRLVCEEAVWIADRALQIHGGYGYTTEFSPERWWRDLRLMTIGGGTSEIMGNIAAKQLGWI